MRNAAAVPALGLLAGTAFGSIWVDVGLRLPFVLLAAAAIAAISSWYSRHPFATTASVAVAFAAGGAILAIDAWHAAWRPALRTAFEELAREQRADASLGRRESPDEDGAFAVLVGVIRTDASLRLNSVSLSLDVTSIERRRGAGPKASDIRVRGGVQLTVAGELAVDRRSEWRAGRVVRVPAFLRRPSRYLNAGVPDGERALARRGTTLVGSVKSGALVELLARGGPLSEAAAEARAFVRKAIDDGVGRWSRRSAAIVTAVLIGDRAGLDESVETRLQEAGTYHVIAISGGNIAILAGLGIVGFRLAGLLGPGAMVTAIATLLAYACLVGGGASVNRATLMAIVYFAGRAIDVRGSSPNALAVAAALLAAAAPLATLDPGFLFTFMATLAILAAMSAAPFAALPRRVAPLVAMFVASAAAEAALLPISALFFNRITVAGLILNLVAIPSMGVVQVAGIAVVASSAVSSMLASSLGFIGHLAAEGLVRSADLLTLAPALTWRVAAPGWLPITMYYVGVVGGWILWRRRLTLGSASNSLLGLVRRSAAAAAFGSAICIAGEPWISSVWPADGRLHVTFIDVGQGDAALVRFPRGASLLVDAGGLATPSSFDLGDRVVAPALRQMGIHRLDWMAISHGDLDHAGGAASIVREFRPRDVWEGIPVPRLPVLRELRSIALDVGARWINLQAADLMSVDGVEIVARHPRLPDWERQEVRNDDSIVLELLWHDVSLVLTGDIGRDVEREIGPLFAPAPMRILKVPHHGSLTSSSREFIRALSPRVAVFSVGRGNTFGHPAPEVIDRYRQAGVQIFRTDRDGAIEIATDGSSIEVRTFTGRREVIHGLHRR